MTEESLYRLRDSQVDTDNHAGHQIRLDDLMAVLMCSPLRVSADVLRASVRCVAARDAVP